MCCFTLSIHTLRLSVGGRTDGRTDGRTENIYSIFRDKLLLRGEHVLLLAKDIKATNAMTKGAKGAPPTKSEMASPVKAGGGTMLKYSPSPTQKKKDERNKPKIANLIYPNGTCYGWAFHNFYAAKEELKRLSNRLA